MTVGRVFWPIVAINAVALLVLLVTTLQASGQNDGGREMAVAFYVALPALIMGVVVLLFVFCAHPVARGLALVVVTAPGLGLAAAQLRHV